MIAIAIAIKLLKPTIIFDGFIARIIWRSIITTMVTNIKETMAHPHTGRPMYRCAKQKPVILHTIISMRSADVYLLN